MNTPKDENEPDIEIELEDAPAADAEIVVEEAGKEKPSVDEDIEALKASVERERNGRIAAETRAAQAGQEVVRARTEAHESNTHLVTNAIAALNMAQEGLEANLAAAQEAGDFAGAASIQREMARNESKIATLEQGKQNLESQPRPSAQPQPSGDPVEDVAASIAAGGAPKSADWVRAHPEYVRDPRLNQKMIAASNLALADGLAVDSPAYFEAVERTLGLRRDDDREAPTSEAAAPVQRRSAPAAAPVSRSGTGDGSLPNRVTLSADEREMASMMQMSDKEYAKYKLELIKEGALGKPN